MMDYKIKITNKELTGTTKYYTVDVEVEDGQNVHELTTVLSVWFDANTNSEGCEVAEFEWNTTEPEPEKKEEIERLAEEAVYQAE